MSLRELTRKATLIAVTACQAKAMRSTARKLVMRWLTARQASDQRMTTTRAGTATQKWSVPAKRQSLIRNKVLRTAERANRICACPRDSRRRPS